MCVFNHLELVHQTYDHLGKIYRYLDTRRWFVRVCIYGPPLADVSTRFSGIGPEISQSIKDIYVAAEVST